MSMDILRHHHAYINAARRERTPSQRAISAKIDNRIDAMVEDEMRHSGIKRNTLINAALEWYLNAIDDARNTPSSPWQESEPHPAEVDSGDKYILSRLTQTNKEFLKHLNAQMGVPLYHAISLGLLLLERDYNERPFRYLPEE